jgi:GT2 family glycosyltransferase
MGAKLVTRIIPVFNRPALLAEAVESVLAQTYRPIEIITDREQLGSTCTRPQLFDRLKSGTAHR